MTRKYYEELAFGLNLEIEKAREMGNSDCLDSLYRVAHFFCKVAILENPRFDRQVFLSACGVTT